MYYLQSRYYAPDTGRFINADDVAFLGATGTALSCNLFAYCGNNPANNSDPTGYFYIPRSIINTILIVLVINPIPAVVIAVGVHLLKLRIIAHLTRFIYKLGIFFGPFIKWCLTVIAGITGLLIAGPFAYAIIDMYLQGKGGVYVTFKKTFWGMPYALDIYAG